MLTQNSSSVPRLFGIPVQVHWSSLLIAGLVAFSGPAMIGVENISGAAAVAVGLLMVVAFGASIVAHELAHALTARRFGVATKRISLWALGGVAELDRDAAKWHQRLLIAIAGPLASVVMAINLGVVGFGLSAFDASVASRIFVVMAALNAVLAVFNMLPGLPLDGGHALAAIAWRATGDEVTGERVAAYTGQGVGVLVTLVGFAGIAGLIPFGSLWTVLMGYFLFGSARGAQKLAERDATLVDATVAMAATPSPPSVRQDMTIAQLRDLWVPSHPFVSHALTVNTAGQTMGMIELAPAVRLNESAAQQLTVERLAVHHEVMAVAGPDEPLRETLRRSASGIVLMVTDGEVTGVVMPGFTIRREATPGVPTLTGPHNNQAVI